MDVITLSLAKKYANKVAAGFSSVQVDGSNLIFTLNDGTKATMTIPTPENGSDGISVVDLSIDTDGSLLCHMSDGSTIDAGKVPTIEPEHVQADWDQNDETQPDYIKNRICYETSSSTETIILEAGTRSFDLQNGDVGLTTYSFTEEEKQRFTNLGTADGILKLTIGGITMEKEVSIINGVFSGETFQNENFMNGILFVSKDSIESFGMGSVEVELIFTGNSTTVVPIPEKYLPDTVATKQYVDNMFNSIVNGDEVSY